MKALQPRPVQGKFTETARRSAQFRTCAVFERLSRLVGFLKGLETIFEVALQRCLLIALQETLARLSLSSGSTGPGGSSIRAILPVAGAGQKGIFQAVAYHFFQIRIAQVVG